MKWQALMIYQIIFLAYSNLNMMMSKFELPQGALSPCCHCGPQAPPGWSDSATQRRGIFCHPPWRPRSGWRCGRASATLGCVSPSRPFSSPRTHQWAYLNKRLWNIILNGSCSLLHIHYRNSPWTSWWPQACRSRYVMLSTLFHMSYTF